MQSDEIGACSETAAYWQDSPVPLMSDVKSPEDAVRSLPAKELAEFRRWFAEFDNAAWDAQLEDDLVNGKLGSLPRRKPTFKLGRGKSFEEHGLDAVLAVL